MTDSEKIEVIRNYILKRTERKFPHGTTVTDENILEMKRITLRVLIAFSRIGWISPQNNK